MARGDVLPSEAEESTDPRTGVRIRQVTSFPAIHHHPFYYLPAYDDAMRHLVFVSHRTGHPQVFLERREHAAVGEEAEEAGRQAQEEGALFEPLPEGGLLGRVHVWTSLRRLAKRRRNNSANPPGAHPAEAQPQPPRESASGPPSPR